MVLSHFRGGGHPGLKIKVAQNGLKHIAVLDFLKSYEIFKIPQMATGHGPSKRTIKRANAQTP